MNSIFKLYFKKLSTSNHSAYFSREGSGFGAGFGWGNGGQGDNVYYCTERYDHAEGCGVERYDNDKLGLIDENNEHIRLFKKSGVY